MYIFIYFCFKINNLTLDFETFWLKENVSSNGFIEDNRLIFDYLDENSLGTYVCVAIPNENSKIGSSKLKIELKLDQTNTKRVQIVFTEYDTDVTALRIGKKMSFDLKNVEKLVRNKADVKVAQLNNSSIYLEALRERDENGEDDNIDYDNNHARESSIKHFNNNLNRDLKIYLKNPKKSFIQIGDKIEFVCVTNSIMKGSFIKWTKENGKFSQRVTLNGHISNKLKIESFEDEDVGIYSCSLEETNNSNRLINKLSISIKSIQIDLFIVSVHESLITPRIEIKNFKSLYDFSSNNKLGLECSSDGNIN